MAEKQLAHAKQLIQAKQYEEARALLITIDHPTADKWLDRLNKIPKAARASTTEEKDYNTRAVALVVLYVMLFIPDFIAGNIWSREAKQDIAAGRPVRGADTLIAIHTVVRVLVIAGLVIVLAVALIESARLNGSSII